MRWLLRFEREPSRTKTSRPSSRRVPRTLAQALVPRGDRFSSCSPRKYSRLRLRRSCRQLLGVEHLEDSMSCGRRGQRRPRRWRRSRTSPGKPRLQATIGDDHSHGVAVIYRLAQGHDVGPRCSRRSNPPEVRTRTAQSILHLVGDDEAARGAHAGGDGRPPSGGRIEYPAAGDRRIDVKGRRLEAPFAQSRDRSVGVLHGGRELQRRSWHRRRAPAMPRRRDGHDSQIMGFSLAGGERRHGIGDAVIGVLHDQASVVAGGHPGQGDTPRRWPRSRNSRKCRH